MNSTTFLFVSALACLTAGSLQADEVIAASESTAKEKAPLTAAQIDELLAPIALYPDPLIAIILPAATFPTDVVMAARYLKDGGSTTNIEAQDWDDSVKALARYPDVLKWMDENLAWTKQLGSVFVLQPAAVLSGTQRLRTEAIAAGNLKTTPQQTVVVEREVVRIVPAQRDIIYVPVYDPVYVYRPCPVGVVYYPRSVVSFSIGYPAGFWLSYDCNWGLNTVVVISRPYRTVVWNRYPSWNHPRHAIDHCHAWNPSPVRIHTVRREFDRHPDKRVVARPSANTYVQHRTERDAFNREIPATAQIDNRRSNRPDKNRLVDNKSTLTPPANTTPLRPARTTELKRPSHAPLLGAQAPAPRQLPKREARVELPSSGPSPALAPRRPQVSPAAAPQRSAMLPPPRAASAPRAETPSSPRSLSNSRPLQVAPVRASSATTPASTSSSPAEKESGGALSRNRTWRQ